MRFGQLLTSAGMAAPQIPMGPPAGVVLAHVTAPVGNAPARNFLAATAWPQVAASNGACYPLFDDACPRDPFGPPPPNEPAPWHGHQPQTCRPLPHDFYNQYPGAVPAGPPSAKSC